MPAIADLFSFPCQITGDGGQVSVTIVPTPEELVPLLEWLVSAYRTIGVRSAEILELRVIEVGPPLAQAAVRWRLVAADGNRIYDFSASYTLADLGDGMRIVAIAHNETIPLRTSIENSRGR